MKTEKQIWHLFKSLALIIMWTLLNVAIYYPANNAFGASFGLAIMYIATEQVALAAGIIILIVRFFLKDNSYFLYVLAGSLNLVIGLLCVFLYYLGKADLLGLNKCLLNLLVGFIMLADTFIVFPKNK